MPASRLFRSQQEINGPSQQEKKEFLSTLNLTLLLASFSIIFTLLYLSGKSSLTDIQLMMLFILATAVVYQARSGISMVYKKLS